MKSIEEGFEVALKNQQVIYGALKKTNIYNTRFDYLDYVKEALIVYAECYANYQGNFDQQKFNNFAYQKIVWSILDMLRREKKFSENHVLSDFEDLDFEQDEILSMQEFKNLSLSDVEKTILFDHLINEEPLSKIAMRLEVSDRYLRKIRMKLLDKMRIFSK